MAVENPARYPGGVAVTFDRGYDFDLPVVTNSDGRATVFLQLGNQPGPGFLVASEPGAGAIDSIPYLVKSGNPVKMSVSVRDTAVWLNNNLTRVARVVDRMRDPTTEVVALQRLEQPSWGAP